jgi:hypothetical protein
MDIAVTKSAEYNKLTGIYINKKRGLKHGLRIKPFFDQATAGGRQED